MEKEKSKKLDKSISSTYIEEVLRLCNTDCSLDEAMLLKKYYMNKYGNYMASRIVTVLMLEFMYMLLILNTGIDSLWRGIPYAETIIYGTIWCSGGIYLLQMMIRVIRNTYYLKLALDDKKVKKYSGANLTEYNRCNNSKKNTFKLFLLRKRRNGYADFYIHESKHRKLAITHNISPSDKTGTSLEIYNVEAKNKNHMFIMVKGRQINESADKLLKDIFGSKLAFQKVKHKAKLSIVKDKLKRKKK